MLKKSILMSLLLCVSLNAKDIYLNGTIIKDSDNYFRNISMEEISNKIWLKINFKEIMYNNYNKHDKPFRDLVSFEEYQESEIEKIKKDYILLNSTGLDKKESVKLYLDVLNQDINTILTFRDVLDKPVNYNNMIEFINHKSNNYGEIDTYDNSINSIREMVLNYKFYNYAGKINVNNKISEIISNLKDEEKELAFDFLREIKPDTNIITNLELIEAYYNIYINNNKEIPILFTKDPLIKLVIKFNSHTLTKQEYPRLKKQIDLIEYSKYLIDSDYIKNIINKVENSR